MNFLDIKTVLFVHAVIDIVCTLMILLLWRQNRRRFPGLLLLVYTFVFMTVSLTLIGLRGIIPDLISIIFANFLLVTGVFLCYAGLERFVAQKSSHTFDYLLLMVYAVAQVYFTYVLPDLATRIFLSSSTMLIFSIQGLWLMLRRVPPYVRRYTLEVGLSFGAYALVNAIRALEVIAGPHPANHLLRSGNFQAIMLIAYQMMFVVFTYTIILMINKRLNLEIQSQESKFSKIFQSSPSCIIITGVSDGFILDANESCFDVLGYRPDEIIGRTTLDIRLWNSEKERNAIITTILEQGRMRDVEYQLPKKNGETMTGIVSTEIIDINERRYIMAQITDITNLKRAEEKLKDLNANLQQKIEEETGRRLIQERIMAEQSRLAAMGKMINAIAHQWRQPLSTLAMIVQRMYAQAAMKKMTVAQLDDFKGGAMRQINHMSDTIEGFRNFYLPEKEKVSFSPHACIQEVIKLVSSQFTHNNIMIDLNLEEESQRFIRSYPNELKQVLLNLLGNAKDAILSRLADCDKPDAGQIRIHCYLAKGNSLWIDISDNGGGIPDDVTRQLFQPYFTTKAESGGTGIGLYMSKMIIEESFHGRLSLVQGTEQTTFRIELPLEVES